MGSYCLTRFSRAMALLLFATAAVPALAAEVETRGDATALEACSSFSWALQDRIPVFDPLLAPDTPKGQQKLVAVDRSVRAAVEEALKKKGRPVTTGATPCLLSYVVLEELDMDIARYNSGNIAPRSSDPVGGGNPEAKADTTLNRLATVTLYIRRSPEAPPIWQGSLQEKVGRDPQTAKRVEKIARKVAQAVPSR